MAKEYPAQPVVGVGAVVVNDGRVLVIRRGQEPRKGQWSLPGGVVRLGEPLVEALRREMLEETGLDVAVGPIVETFDRIHRDDDGRVRYHFVIVDYLCSVIAGDARAGDDAEEVKWIGEHEIDQFGINAHAAAVLRRGLALANSAL
jgi:ADP-ribose pyrophosphatase YjhB (NUDIX family)